MGGAQLEMQAMGPMFEDLDRGRAAGAAEAPAVYMPVHLPNTPATELFLNTGPFSQFFPEAAQTPRQARTTCHCSSLAPYTLAWAEQQR